MFNPKVLGLAAWTLRIANFGPIRKARLQRRFEKEGADLVDEIKAVVPRDKGNLAASIRMAPAPKKPGVLIIAGGTPETARGPNLDEALLTEYGTRKERAEPYFWPTVEASKGGLKTAIADGMRADEAKS